MALIQFTSPHAFLSTATGLGFSARAIGGAFGSAVIDAIVNGKIASTYNSGMAKSAIGAGLPAASVPDLLTAFATGSASAIAAVNGINAGIIATVTNTSHELYAHAFRLAYARIIPFIVMGIVCVVFLKGVKDLMTEHVEATVEHVHPEDKAIQA